MNIVHCTHNSFAAFFCGRSFKFKFKIGAVAYLCHTYRFRYALEAYDSFAGWFKFEFDSNWSDHKNARRCKINDFVDWNNFHIKSLLIHTNFCEWTAYINVRTRFVASVHMYFYIDIHVCNRVFVCVCVCEKERVYVFCHQTSHKHLVLLTRRNLSWRYYVVQHTSFGSHRIRETKWWTLFFFPVDVEFGAN